jgi:hypothetical protein
VCACVRACVRACVCVIFQMGIARAYVWWMSSKLIALHIAHH